MAKAVPEGMHTITAQLAIDGCDKAIEWYQKAFGAELLSRASDPSGKKVWHASMRIGNSIIFVNDVFPEMGGGAQTASLWLYTDNVDQAFKRAADAGGKTTMPLGDMFWGDRMGQLADPFGNKWTLAQHMKDLTPDEMKKAQDAFVASMAAKK
jgi:PhnB protein